MTLRKLGSTGLQIGPLGLGSVNFSWLTDEADSFAILDAAFERGVNLLDTSDNYNAGQTEALIGRWFAQGGGRREKTVLCTQVYSAPMEWGSPDPVKRSGSWVGPNQKGLSAKHIREACEASLKRLNTDHIDLYQMHHVDRDTPWEEIWQAMDLLVAQGKVIYVGSSNFAGWHLAKANEAARRRNSLGLVSEQSLYNLNARMVELEVLPACQDYGMAVIPWSPLGGGMLGGVLDGLTEGRRSGEGFEARVQKMRPQLEQWEQLCKDLGEQPADVALAWLLHQPAVTSPIIGPRTLEQFTGALRALDISLDDDVLKQLDQIFPGPGGAAPEAYAW
jgi:aryl-alcohol dehydrogenase-like predicted oxidoreductase